MNGNESVSDGLVSGTPSCELKSLEGARGICGFFSSKYSRIYFENVTSQEQHGMSILDPDIQLDIAHVYTSHVIYVALYTYSNKS